VLVVVAASELNVGMVRVELLRAADQLAALGSGGLA
jgi:predicted regulator of Ras-like GTPase activity (Roadblock/LC7/MglB family)